MKTKLFNSALDYGRTFTRGMVFAAGVVFFFGVVYLFAADFAVKTWQSGEVLSADDLNANFKLSANPVGTIIASGLAQSQMDAAIGKSNVYVIAKGQDVTGSKYHEITGNSTAPDLEGRFLRGIDATNGTTRDPDGARAFGNVQEDAFQGHHHLDGFVLGKNASNSTPYWGASVAVFADRNYIGDPITDGTNGAPRTSSETRPKNISVYYYIRIN